MECNIVIDIKGSISMLEPKRNSGPDLKGLGRAEVVRATDIIWDAEEEGWAVVWLIGPFKGEFLREHLLTSAENTGNTVYASSYEEAASFEVKAFNNLLKLGYL